MGRIIRERKLNYNKPDQEFECELLSRTDSAAVIRYVNDQAYPLAGRVIAPGSCTLGLYRQGADYVFWKMLRPDGALEGYLAHLCKPIELAVETITYRDMMLDIWQSPPEAPVLLDEDDLEAAVLEGLLSRAEAFRSLGRAAALMDAFPDIIRQAEEALR